MGELAGNWYQDSPEGRLAQDNKVEIPKDKVETSVTGCFADAINKRDQLPIFRVNHNEFHQNMSYGRQRIRFKTGSDVQKFMQGSKYKQSFWIQHKDTEHMRKIK